MAQPTYTLLFVLSPEDANYFGISAPLIASPSSNPSATVPCYTINVGRAIGNVTICPRTADILAPGGNPVSACFNANDNIYCGMLGYVKDAAEVAKLKASANALKRGGYRKQKTRRQSRKSRKSRKSRQSRQSRHHR